MVTVEVVAVEVVIVLVDVLVEVVVLTGGEAYIVPVLVIVGVVTFHSSRSLVPPHAEGLFLELNQTYRNTLGCASSTGRVASR